MKRLFVLLLAMFVLVTAGCGGEKKQEPAPAPDAKEEQQDGQNPLKQIPRTGVLDPSQHIVDKDRYDDDFDDIRFGDRRQSQIKIIA